MSEREPQQSDLFDKDPIEGAEEEFSRIFNEPIRIDRSKLSRNPDQEPAVKKAREMQREMDENIKRQPG